MAFNLEEGNEKMNADFDWTELDEDDMPVNFVETWILLSLLRILGVYDKIRRR